MDLYLSLGKGFFIMTKIKLQMNTNDMILYHLIQRFVYQYHSLFSKYKTHPSLDDLTQLWFLKIFYDNPYFQNMPNSVLVNYEIQENKDLLVVSKLQSPTLRQGIQQYVVKLDL